MNEPLGISKTLSGLGVMPTISHNRIHFTAGGVLSEQEVREMYETINQKKNGSYLCLFVTSKNSRDSYYAPFTVTECKLITNTTRGNPHLSIRAIRHPEVEISNDIIRKLEEEYLTHDNLANKT